MTNTLLELLSNEQTILNSIIEAEGEILPDFEHVMKENKLALHYKIDAWDSVLERLDQEIELWKRREEEIYRVRKKIEACADRMRESLKQAMEHHEITELNGSWSRFKLVIGAPKVEVIKEPTQEQLSDLHSDKNDWVTCKFGISKTRLAEKLLNGSFDGAGYFKVTKSKQLRRYLARGDVIEKPSKHATARVGHGTPLSPYHDGLYE